MGTTEVIRHKDQGFYLIGALLGTPVLHDAKTVEWHSHKQSVRWWWSIDRLVSVLSYTISIGSTRREGHSKKYKYLRGVIRETPFFSEISCLSTTLRVITLRCPYLQTFSLQPNARSNSDCKPQSLVWCLLFCGNFHGKLRQSVTEPEDMHDYALPLIISRSFTKQKHVNSSNLGLLRIPFSSFQEFGTIHLNTAFRSRFWRQITLAAYPCLCPLVSFHVWLT